MKKPLLIAALAAIVSIPLSAQVKVAPGGKMELGSRCTLSTFTDTLTVLHLYGPYTQYRAGARMKFGDGEGLYGHNVTIGEWGHTDTDILWLHGKKGVKYTHTSSGDKVIFEFVDSDPNYFSIECELKTKSVLLKSDAQFKENIEPLENTSRLLAQLTPVSYTLKPDADVVSRKMPSSTGDTEKDARDREFYAEYYNKMSQAQTHYGLIAQEVKEIFPELVREDGNGDMFVDYIGLIPVLIDAVKDLSGKVEELENPSIDTPAIRKAAAGTDGPDALLPFLGQNTPNPTNGATTIPYCLPADCASAAMHVFNLQGNLLKTYTLSASEREATLTIEADEFAPGMYAYALVADNTEIGTRRMIITK